MKRKFIRVDTIKLRFPTNFIEDYDKSLFIEKRGNKNKSGVTEDYDYFYGEKTSNPYPGILYLKIVNKRYLKGQKSKLNMDTKVTMKVSAKVLGEDYLEMMNRNNFHKVIENINKTGLIRISPEGFIEEAQVLSCDVTCNLPLTTEINKYIESLYRLAIANHKLKVASYPRKESNILSGLTLITKTKKNNRKRILFYEKYYEITSKGKKFDFLSNKEKEQFRNILRIEVGLNTFKHIRKYLNIQNSLITLKDVLNSNSNPISTQLNELLRLKNFVQLYEKGKLTKYMEGIREVNREKVLKICKENMRHINTFLKIKYSNPYYQRTKYINTYVRMNRDKLKMALIDFMHLRKMIR